MNSLIKNIFIYLLLLFLFGFVTRHISFKIDKNYSIKNNIDVLIIGASDTQNAIDDEVLKNSINLSDKGRHNLINYLILKKILKDNPQINKVIYGLSRNIVDSGIDKRWLDTRPKILTKILKYADFPQLSSNSKSIIVFVAVEGTASHEFDQCSLLNLSGIQMILHI